MPSEACLSATAGNPGLPGSLLGPTTLGLGLPSQLSCGRTVHGNSTAHPPPAPPTVFLWKNTVRLPPQTEEPTGYIIHDHIPTFSLTVSPGTLPTSWVACMPLALHPLNLPPDDPGKPLRGPCTLGH